MDEVHLARFSDILPGEKLDSTRINIIGAGAVGSMTAVALAKMGFMDIHVWDFDDVEDENVGVQMFGPSHVGKLKVDALAEIVKLLADEEITKHREAYEGGVLPGVVISAVDSMKVRQQIWEFHRNQPQTDLLIDPRMGAEFATVDVARPTNKADQQRYAGSLYPDSEAVEERCTEKATTYTAMLLGGMVAKVVKDWVTGGKTPSSIQWSIKEHDFHADFLRS